MGAELGLPSLPVGDPGNVAHPSGWPSGEKR